MGGELMTYFEIYFNLFPGVCILWAAWMVSWALVRKETGMPPIIHLPFVLLVTAVPAAVICWWMT